MTPIRMVHMRTVPTAFHARVIAARLGAEGIVTQLRGNIGGPYPFGEVSVWVDAEDAEVARDLLLADEVEASFDTDPPGEDEMAGRAGLGRWTARRVLAALGLVLVVGAALSTRILP
jgi:hypothetical protein